MSNPQIVEGRADGISLELAFKDAMDKAPHNNLNMYRLVEFRVESGGVVGRPTCSVKIEYTSR